MKPAMIPGFALQHLVENAVRHGIARSPDAAQVSIVARRAGDALEVSVVDDGAGVEQGATSPAGHGIENTRARLRALYGDRASAEVIRRTPHGTMAMLRVPYRDMPTESERGDDRKN